MRSVISAASVGDTRSIGIDRQHPHPPLASDRRKVSFERQTLRKHGARNGVLCAPMARAQSELCHSRCTNPPRIPLITEPQGNQTAAIVAAFVRVMTNGGQAGGAGHQAYLSDTGKWASRFPAITLGRISRKTGARPYPPQILRGAQREGCAFPRGPVTRVGPYRGWAATPIFRVNPRFGHPNIKCGKRVNPGLAMFSRTRRARGPAETGLVDPKKFRGSHQEGRQRASDGALWLPSDAPGGDPPTRREH